MLGNIVEPKNGKVLSGYRIYDAEQKRRTLRNDLSSLYPDLPGKSMMLFMLTHHGTIVEKCNSIKSGKKDINKNWEKNTFISAANFQYPTFKTKEMKKIPIYEIAKDGCCYPENWRYGVNCVEKEDAFYVKTKININLLAALSEPDLSGGAGIFKKDSLISSNSNPHLLYGSLNRWKFIDENGNEICQIEKGDGHHHFRLIRNDTIDELIIGPLPKKPRKMIIEILDSKCYEGITPELEIKTNANTVYSK